MLTHLELVSFRNLEPTQLQFAPGRHLLLGPNGAGKTSLLEAIYLLATTRSFRTHRLAECIRHGTETFHLVAETVKRQRLEAFYDSGQRERRLNGVKTTLADHLAALPVIAWTAADREVLIGPPDARRRFIDRGVVGLRSSSLEAISRYRHALDGKKELLRSGQARDAVQLGVWNDLLAEAAAQLVRRRADYVDRLSTALLEVLDDADLGLPPVELTYRPSPNTALEGPAAVRSALESVASRETLLQQSLVGPQRDELAIRWCEDGELRALKRIASAGERKALGLALLVAHGRVLESEHVSPLVLLDDVDVELDPSRLSRLWSILSDHRQVIVTSARPAVWQDLEFDSRWQVESGRITVSR